MDKNSFCTPAPIPRCFVQLGKLGDLISLLPAFKHSFEVRGVKPVVMVEERYADLFDGVSYVEPWAVQFRWPAYITEARKDAQRHYTDVVVPQFWNDDQLIAMPSPGSSVATLSMNNRNWSIDITRWPNCSCAMWDIAGLDPKKAMLEKVVFDRRDLKREQALASTVSSWKKPVILYNLEGASCPFGMAPEVLKALWPYAHVFQLVDLARVKAHRVYDLLGLFDRAAGLITVDTATLHLAAASRVPFIAFTNDGWSRAQVRGNCVMEIPYSKVQSRITDIAVKAEELANTHFGRRAIEPYNPHNPPSILAQTPWKVRILNEMPKDAEYFNCGIVDRPDGRWLVARRAAVVAGNKYGVNTLMAFPMKDGLVSGDGVPLKTISLFQDEHFEDPRVFYRNGITYVSCCNFVWGKFWTGAHQILFEADDSWMVRRRFDVVYGKNGNHVAANSGMEKNWLWFFHDNQPHMVYSAQPHQVVRFDDKFNAVEKFDSFSKDLSWPFGQLRGGTPPVLIGDEYWTFFHSSTAWAEQGTARYHMGAYAFEARPPFRKTRYTKLPLMSGSQYDRWAHPKPLVVFPCGAVIKDGTWAVSMGVNDLYCATVEIPHSELEKQMTEIKL